MRDLRTILIHGALPLFVTSVLLLAFVIFVVFDAEVRSWSKTAQDFACVIVLVYAALGGVLCVRVGRAYANDAAIDPDRPADADAPEPPDAHLLVDNLDDAPQRRAYLAEHEVDCPGCGYNLRGGDGVACPECGRAVTGSDLDSASALERTIEQLARPALLDPTTWGKRRTRTPAWIRLIALLLLLMMILSALSGGSLW